MVWNNLLAYIRLRIPEISSTTVISDANMLILTNLICKEFADLTECLPTYTQFDTVNGTQIYSVSTEIPTYLRMRKEGAFWYDTTNTKWTQLRSRLFSQINEHEKTWINRGSGSPLYFWIEGNEIGLHPKPDTTTLLDTGVRVYHYAQSTNMDGGTKYPFSGSTTQYPHLAQYDETIVDGVRYKVKQILNKAQEAEEPKALFFAKCEKIKQELLSRPDLVKDSILHGAGYSLQDFS